MLETVANVPAQNPHSPNDVVADVALRLREAVELATREHGKMLIAAIFARVHQGPRKRADRAREKLVATLTRQFFRAIEKMQRKLVRDALVEERAKRKRAAREAVKASRGTASTRIPGRRRGRIRPLPPPLDPEQLKRDAEFARLRALLRPAAEEPPPPALAAVVVAPAVPAPRPATPGDVMRALEKEIQNAVPTLPALGPERCGAQIAAWAGQVRELRDRLASDVLAVMRPAFRIFLEHLTELRAAMEAHFVDALEPKWSAPDWGIYIEVNRARTEGRSPNLSADQLEAHHRSMLRALVLPHRRNVPGQAIPVINAAAEVLTTDDSQLRSAVRRHTSEWKARAKPGVQSPPGSPPTEEPAEDVTMTASEPAEEEQEPSPVASNGTTPENTEPPASDAATPDSEFDRPWTK